MMSFNSSNASGGGGGSRRGGGTPAGGATNNAAAAVTNQQLGTKVHLSGSLPLIGQLAWLIYSYENCENATNVCILPSWISAILFFYAVNLFIF